MAFPPHATLFPAAYSRHTRQLYRSILIAALLMAFASLFVGLWAGRRGFTNTALSSNNRLPQQANTSPDGRLELSGQHSASTGCNPLDLAHLQDLGLSRKVTYSRRCIEAISSDDVDRAVVTNINSTLLTKSATIDLDNLCSTDVENLPCHPLELHVPPPEPEACGQYAHLLFGVATSFKRLRDSKATFSHWLAHSGATLVCLITDDITEVHNLGFVSLEADYAASGINLELVAKHDPNHSPEYSHIMVVRDLMSYANASSTTPHWIGILDDDTFIPSLHALST